jgi:fatty acid desaturase
MTANIGVHHVHHLNSRIPFNRLLKVFRDQPDLCTIGRMTLVAFERVSLGVRALPSDPPWGAKLDDNTVRRETLTLCEP